MRSDGVESIYWAGTESGLMDIYKVPGVIYAAIQWGGIDLLGGHGVRPNGHLQLPWGYHQEITLVCICRLRMCLYVTMTLIDIYISKNFYLISLRRLIFNPTYICCIGIKRHIMLYYIYS